MDLIKTVNTFINPFGTIIILLFAILVILFFANSKKTGAKLFGFIFTLLIHIAAFAVNIVGFVKNSTFSDNLFTSGIAQIIEISFIIIFSIILFIIIFIFNKGLDSFLVVNIIFIFSTASLIFFTISRNFIVFFISLIFFLISVFSLITLLNEAGIFLFKKNDSQRRIIEAGRHHTIPISISKFFLSVLLSILFIFFGMSLLYGVSDFKNFIQLNEAALSFQSSLGFVFVIFAVAIYLYFGFFPFQAPYIKVTSKISSDSDYILWLYYFLPGSIFLTRLSSVIYAVAGDFRNIFIISMSALVIVATVGSGLAVLKNNNLRKIVSNLVLLIFAGNIFNLLLFISDQVNENMYRMLNFFGCLLLIVSFLPLALIFTLIEKKCGSVNINEIKSVFIKNKAVSVGFVITGLSLLGVPAFAGFMHKNHYINIIKKAWTGGIDTLTPVAGWLLIAAAIIYLAFFTAGTLRIMISVFIGKKSMDNKEIKFTTLPIIFIYFFVFLIIALGVFYLLDISGINIYGLSFNSVKLF